MRACLQDENADSSRRPGSPALRLHAFDLSAQRWSVLRCSGAPSFAKLEALLCHGSTLLAVGWSPAMAKADGGMAVRGRAGAEQGCWHECGGAVISCSSRPSVSIILCPPADVFPGPGRPAD